MKSPLHFGLIGENISYSRSVDIFDAIFRHTGQAGRFDIYSLKPSELSQQLKQLPLDGLTAFSVTIPYKQIVLSELDEIDTIAQRLQAVNSIAVIENRLLGYNTDCCGFVIPLRPYASQLRNGTALILGSGGAARAVLYALRTDCKMSRFIVAGRSPGKLADYKSSMEAVLDRTSVETAKLDKIGSQDFGKLDLVVNCTPLGGPNHPGDHPFQANGGFPECKFYYDLNYNQPNPLIGLAAASGVVCIDGSAMLVGQAIRSFDIWTGTSVPFAAIYEQVFGRQLSV